MSDSPKPTLFLHIGRPKTGSTALQHFLVNNRVLLRQKGVLYPLTGRHQRASHLFAYAYAPDMRRAAGLAEMDPDTLWRDLAGEVAQAAPSKVILSSENLWFVDPRRLPEDLSRDYQVKVIVYIRRQDNVIASSFCEEVKREQIDLNADVKSYSLYAPRLQLLDYYRMLKPWGLCFGSGNVYVRIYETVAGNVQEDLCRLLDIDPAVCELDATAINPSFPFDVLSLISRARRIPLGDFAQRRFVTMVSEALALLDYDPAYDPGGLFSLQLRQLIMRNFEESNAAILKEFVRDGSHQLFPPLETQEYLQPRKDMDPVRMALLFTGLYSGQEKTNLRLSRRIQSLESQLKSIIERLEEQE